MPIKTNSVLRIGFLPSRRRTNFARRPLLFLHAVDDAAAAHVIGPVSLTSPTCPRACVYRPVPSRLVGRDLRIASRIATSAHPHVLFFALLCRRRRSYKGSR